MCAARFDPRGHRPGRGRPRCSHGHRKAREKESDLPFFETPGGVRLAYEDHGTGRPVVLLAGWTLAADMWEYQLPFLVDGGYRCVLLDRRGHGRSDRPSGGYDLDTLADDVATLPAVAFVSAILGHLRELVAGAGH